jgi:general L-amino acid transport system permease protein
MEHSAPVSPAERRARRRRALRDAAWQAATLLALAALGWWLWRNAADNIAARQIRSGFAFLGLPVGFEIGESLIAFSPADSYARAFAVGLGNTLRVSVLGILLTTVLGLAVGTGQLASHYLVRKLCTGYVELVRNTPLVLQLFVWYIVATELLPPAMAALQPVPGVFLSNSGLQFPLPAWGAQGFAWDVPQPGRFAIAGGGTVSPEFLALLAGLTVYTASYVAEIVRAGILAVPRGQVDAALGLGMTRWQALARVQLPQARRVIIPALTSQYLNLTKNSSLAVAVGYPDLVSIANTSINQTGQAVECILVIMAVYLALSLATSLVMNLYNRRATMPGH